MFVLISNFWEAFLGSNFSINFLILLVLVLLNLKILDLLLVLINLMNGWLGYLLMLLEAGSSPDESKLSYSLFSEKFLIRMLMKYLLNRFAIRWSWEITLSSSVKVILKFLLVLSVKKCLAVFQKILFFVKKLALDEQNMDVMEIH